MSVLLDLNVWAKVKVYDVTDEEGRNLDFECHVDSAGDIRIEVDGEDYIKTYYTKEELIRLLDITVGDVRATGI